MAAEAVHEVPAHCTVEIKLGELHAGRNPLLLQQLRTISVQGATQFEVGHCRGVMVGRRRCRRRRRSRRRRRRRTKLVPSGQRFIGTPGGEGSPQRVTIAPHFDQKVGNYKDKDKIDLNH